MKTLFSLFFISAMASSIYGQVVKTNTLEARIKKYSNNGSFEKTALDLNNDGRNDLLYHCDAGEIKLLYVLLNTNGHYEKAIDEEPYSLMKINHEENKTRLELILHHCCGDNVFYSVRRFDLDKKGIKLTGNYVITDSAYTDHSVYITPKKHLPATYHVRTEKGYNLRFAPSLNPLDSKGVAAQFFSVENGSNIIAKLKQGAEALVLAELMDKNRKWLFVEVDSAAITNSYNPIDFGFKDQKLRGWLSSKFVVRTAQ